MLLADAGTSFYRALAWIVTAAYFWQAVFAGQFMAGTYGPQRRSLDADDQRTSNTKA